MKSKKTTKILISSIVSIMFVLVVFFTVSAAGYDYGIDYTDEDSYSDWAWSPTGLKIIDNIAYKYVPKSKSQSAHYEVIAYGVTKAVREKMTEINIPSEIDNIPVTAINVVYNKEGVIAGGEVSVMDSYPKVTKITIPETVTEIGPGAFMGLENIKSITLPKNLKKLSSSAFSYLKNITEVTIPKGVSKIDLGMFNRCTGLKKVVFEGDITFIGDSAFYGCSNLKYITQCNSLTYIGEFAFANCKNLKYFNLSSTLTKIGGGAFSGSGITSVIIPSKAKLDGLDDEFADNFKNCRSLKTVIFENRKGTLYINPTCFEGCASLETVVLPTSTNEIMIFDRAFKNCTNLKNIVNPEDISYVGEASFAFCKSLKSINFSSKLDWIGRKAFYGCEKLSSITFTGTKLPAGSKGKRFEKNTFFKTPENIKFYVKDTKTAKLFKDALKGSGVKNARIYIPQSSKLAYKNVK